MRFCLLYTAAEHETFSVRLDVLTNWRWVALDSEPIAHEYTTVVAPTCCPSSQFYIL